MKLDFEIGVYQKEIRTYDRPFDMREFRTPNAVWHKQGGHAQFWPKISNLSNKVKTRQMGALIVTSNCVLGAKIHFFLEIGQKCLNYEPSVLVRLTGKKNI